MAVRTAIAPLLNWTTPISLGMGLGLGFLMPFSMRLWIRIMQASPSGALAGIGLAIGIIGAIASMVWFLLEAFKQAKLRKQTPGLTVKPLSLWHFPVHILSLYLIALPAAVCLIISNSETLSAADWAMNEEKLVEAVKSLLF